MSDIPSFPYSILWGERQIISVANLTRQDGIDFLTAAARVNIRTHTTVFPLDQANEALARLREGRLVGAAVLLP
jgi:propanol-preferring alcohol dehydrogenase